MATVTQVNGLTTLATDYNFTNIREFVIQIAGADTTWYDSEVADGAIIEILTTTYQPLRYKAYKSGNNGYIKMWLEGNSRNADTIKAEIRALGATVGVNSIDLTTVEVSETSF